MSVYTKNVKTGWYNVVNKDKLVNEKKSLYYRSSLELKFMQICDGSKNILSWSYEKVVIPYNRFYENGKARFYVMDFWIKKDHGNGVVKEYLVEIKPSSFLQPPITPKRKTKKYLELIENYSINISKWQNAIEFAKQNNMTFTILTEKHLCK